MRVSTWIQLQQLNAQVFNVEQSNIVHPTIRHLYGTNSIHIPKVYNGSQKTTAPQMYIS